ncbi:hypothetical protein M0R45_008334 [Rubus argutus]|uniref:Nop domain-containing protein n=1 Tax=Rubus argutus TaxID=59490 RepID=A0AAW1Y1W0_RUBAR
MPPSPCFLLSSTALLTRPPRHPASLISVRLFASSQFGITAAMLDSAQHRRRAQRVQLDPPWSPLLLRHQAALQAAAVTKPMLCLDLVAASASQSLPASTSLSLSYSLPALADLFLADLDELSDNEADVPLEDDADVVNMEEDVDGDLVNLETLNYVDLDSVSKLHKSQRFADIMHHNFIGDKYRPKFPELESLAHHIIDYARVLQKIGNETDVTFLDLEGILPSAIIMVDACDGALAPNSAEKKVPDFVEK